MHSNTDTPQYVPLADVDLNDNAAAPDVVINVTSGDRQTGTNVSIRRGAEKPKRKLKLRTNMSSSASTTITTDLLRDPNLHFMVVDVTNTSGAVSENKSADTTPPGDG